MILFFGTKPGKAKTQVLHTISCPYCKQAGTLSVVSVPNYFHLFWISLFKIHTSSIVQCSHCRKAYGKDEFTEDMERAIDQDKLG